jgi:hypothetical protein
MGSGLIKIRNTTQCGFSKTDPTSLKDGSRRQMGRKAKKNQQRKPKLPKKRFLTTRTFLLLPLVKRRACPFLKRK